jgi:DNA processing protein
MDHDGDRLLRLGLLLAGGGAAVRRRVAEFGGGGGLATALAAANLPRATLETARRLAETEAEGVCACLADKGWRWMVPNDQGYPPLLSGLGDAPLGLFVRGRLADGPVAAIVGSRSATPYGRQVARLLGEELGRAGVVVASGMARGVDASVHQGAIASGGATWAVWGTGPDRLYPPEHAALAEEIARTGAILTEYLPGTPPRRHHFPERNRILAGLAQVVVVVEAAARSGALITARLALEEGREVMAVPGNIFSEQSVGPNTLLRVGARPLLTPRDLFDALGVEPSAVQPQPDSDCLLSLFEAGEALTADEFAHRAEVDPAVAASELLKLELDGAIAQSPDGRYSLVRPPLPGRPGGGRP